MSPKMCLLLSLLGLVSGVSAAVDDPMVFQPESFQMADLEDATVFAASQRRPTFEQTLSNVGILTVQGIPGYAALRREVLQGARECLEELPEGSFRQHVFDDGTVRKTIAVATGSELGDEVDEFGVPGCAEFEVKFSTFRDLVTRVTRVFGDRLSESFAFNSSIVFGGHHSTNLSAMFGGDEHLEHVNSYQLVEDEADDLEAREDTVDMHTDQGFCLAFTPALLIEKDGAQPTPGAPFVAGKLSIRLPGGERVLVKLPEDSLVFMLGDGVNQYVNPALSPGRSLRAVPHSMMMPRHSSDQWRLWYGRMFLPPSNAVNIEQGITYGQLRRRLVDAWANEEDGESAEVLSLGCSGMMRAQEFRQLSDTGGGSDSCASNQLRCWMRCMDFTTDANPTACTAKGLDFKCTNGRDEVSEGGKDHGNYSPKCTDSTTPVQPLCSLQQIPRSSQANAAGFEAFLADQGSFGDRDNLQKDSDGKPEVTFHWNVVANGQVECMIAFNGLVSWIAVGLENPGGAHNGMNGASVVMGVSAEEKEYPGFAGTVKEYKVHQTSSNFDTWNTPLATAHIQKASIVSDNGYTAMKFTGSSVYGTALKVKSGTNRMVWALRSSTYMHIGKESYHSGCDGQTRTRNRGGGATSPWVVEFTSSAADTGSWAAPAASSLPPFLLMISGLSMVVSRAM